MDFELKNLSAAAAASAAVDALLVLVPDEPAKDTSDPLSKLIRSAIEAGDLEEGAGKSLACYRFEGIKAPRIVVLRAGAGDPAAIRKHVAGAMAHLKHPSVKKLALVLSLLPSPNKVLRAAMAGCADGTYTFTTTKPSAKARNLQRVLVGVEAVAQARSEFDHAKAQIAGVEFAKEWANRPANHATPSMLADAARKIGQKPRIKTEVLGPKQVEALGMGAFLAVAKGSAEPLRFIVMHYSGGNKGSAPVVLVGKGITFDTGGISIKPAPDMDEMKFDMGGAASVLGTFAAIAELQPAVNVIGIIPACENMPDGQAVKPGDVVRSMSGQTIEILNTDAEGRLILCDALTYAARFKPHSVIDIATLTGACVIALGGVRSGLFSSKDELATALQQAGENALDPCWRMPLDDEYAEGLKSNFADMGNVAGRAAGSITAAKFLQKFATELPWAHLDIAGTAWKSGAAKGSTGRPVPLLLQYVLDVAASGQGSKVHAPAPRKGRATR